MNKCKISIIVPFYNNEQHIEECIESICCQSIKDIEIITIDNNSVDDSKKIIFKLMKKDSRIKYNFEKTQGSGPARNKGMKISTGKYIMFMDADDYYPNKFALEKLYNVAEKKNKKIVRGNYLSLTVDHKLLKPKILNKFIYVDKEIESMFTDDVRFQTFWGHTTHLFLRKFLLDNNLFSPNLIRGQDPVFLANVYNKYKDKIIWIPDVVYHYRQCNGKWDFENWKYSNLVSIFNSYIKIKNILDTNGYDDVWINYQAVIYPKIKKLLNRIALEEDNELYELIVHIMESIDYEKAKSKIYFNDKVFEDYKLHKTLLKKRIIKEKMLSVIIPVYNVEKYIEDCLKSIINQQFSNYEILLIDDGSTDNSYNICKQYAENDSRITLIHQENNGGGSARNKGLSIAKGEFVHFIDADDILIDNYVYSKIFSHLVKINYDIIYFKMKTISGDKELNNKYNRHYEKPFKKYKTDIVECKIDNYLNSVRNFTPSPCQRIVKRSKINHILFPEGKLSNHDVGFYLQLFSQNLIVKLLPLDVYGRRIHEDSISGKLRKEISEKVENKKRNLDFIRVIDFAYNKIFSNTKDIELMKNFMAYAWDMSYYRLIDTNNDENVINEVRNFFDGKPILNQNKFLKAEQYDKYREILHNKNKVSKYKKERIKEKKYKILCHNLSLAHGGAEKVASDLANQWAKDGHDVTFATTKGLEIIDCYSLELSINRIKFKNFDEFISYIDKNTFDLIVNHNYVRWQNDIGRSVKVAKQNKIKYITVIHNSYFRFSLVNDLFNRYSTLNKGFGLSDVLVTLTKQTCMTYKNRFKNVIRIPNAIDIKNVENNKIREKLIISVGSFTRGDIKRPDRVLKVFNEIKKYNKDYKLYMIGNYDMNYRNPDDNKSLDELMDLYNFSENDVKWLGEIPNVSDYYKIAKLYLHTSTVEGFPMVLLEAASYGVPRVAMNFEGLSDLIEDKKSGYIIKQGDFESMVKNANKILMDEKHAKEITLTALERNKEYTMENVNNLWKECFETILNNNVDFDEFCERKSNDYSLDYKSLIKQYDVALESLSTGYEKMRIENRKLVNQHKIENQGIHDLESKVMINKHFFRKLIWLSGKNIATKVKIRKKLQPKFEKAYNNYFSK